MPFDVKRICILGFVDGDDTPPATTQGERL